MVSSTTESFVSSKAVTSRALAEATSGLREELRQAHEVLHGIEASLPREQEARLGREGHRDRLRERGGHPQLAGRLQLLLQLLDGTEIIQSGELGEPRLFGSVFSTDVEPGNVRLRAGEGGPLYDIGIYCVNAARYLFRAEPEEVLASHARRKDARFVDTPEMTTAVLRFPDDRLATFSCSFGAAHVGTYWIVGTEASLRVDPAYSIGTDLVHHFTRKGRTRSETFKARDQFAAELLYFSDCLPEDREPEPSGEEGLADVRVLRAIERSAEDGRSVKLGPFERRQRPTPAQEISRPLGPKPRLIHAEDPSPAK